MDARSKATSVDEYIAEFPSDVQKLLKEIRKLIRSQAPDATETFSYGIPTFDLNGKHVVHFAGFKNHVSFFPTGSGVAAFEKELSGFKTSKGTVQLPLDQPLPKELIKRIVRFRVEEVTGKRKT